MKLVFIQSNSPARGFRLSRSTYAVLGALALLPAAVNAQNSTQPAPSNTTSNASSNAPTLKEIRIESNQGSFRKGALRDELVKTESISERAIEKSGATNINEAIDKNPGISVQTECSICNVRNVLLNNLPGRYTTLLIDGIPIYSSVSSAYGLDSVSVYGLERIDIARGAGASLIAPEALSGTVNIVTKRPTEDGARLRFQGGSFGSRQADAYAAKVLTGGAITVTGNYNRHDSIDADGDGISEYTGYDRRIFGLGYFVDDLGGFKVRGRLDAVKEKRNGGALGTDYAAIKASTTGNPFNFSRSKNGSPDPAGWVVPDGSGADTLSNGANGALYNAGRGGLSEIIFTDRLQVVTSGEKRVGDGKLRIALGLAEHKQDSFYEIAEYRAKQNQYYLETSYQAPVGKWLLTGGLNYRYEDLRSNGATATGVAVKGIDNYVYRAPGVFFQGYRTLFDDKLEINASLRFDKHSVFGGIVTPRFNALYHHTDELSSRVAVGTGYRAPTSFFEQDHGILDTIAVNKQINNVEKSQNLSYSLNYASDRTAITASYNYNKIKNFAVLRPGGSCFDGSGFVAPNPDCASLGGPFQDATLFTSAARPVVVQGVDINASYQFSPNWTANVAGELYKYSFDAQTLIFARPKAKLYFGLDYDTANFDFNIKAVWTGPMDLRKFHDDGTGVQNRFNFNGTPKADKSPSFLTLDARAEYKINKTAAIYLGVDNLTNYKQTNTDSFLFVNAAGAPDVTHIWGPNRGRFVYAGVKIGF